MVSTPTMLTELYRRARALPLPRARRLFTRSEWLGAAGVAALVVIAAFPAMLFAAGFALGRYAGGRPWLFGVAMAVTGALLVATIILLGG